MRKKTILLGFLLVFGLSFSTGAIFDNSVQAATQANCTTESGNFFGFPTWYKYLEPSFSGGECNLNIQFPESIPAILFAVFEILLRIVGIISVVFITYGGFQYLTSTGEPDKAKNARTTIVNALIGLMIAMLATVIVNLVAGSIV